MSCEKLKKYIKEIEYKEKGDILYRLKQGLSILEYLVDENFLDLEELPKDKFSKTGLFYEIPIDNNYMSDNKVFILVIYKIEEKEGRRSSHCPIRFDFKYINDDEAIIYLYDQRETGTRTFELIHYIKDKGIETNVPGYDTKNLTLSEMIEAVSKCK